MASMGKYCVLVALAAAIGGQAMAEDKVLQPAEQPSPLVYQRAITGDIVIGPDGHVRDYKLKNEEITPAVADVIDRSILKWRFEPILVDGKPVNAKTSLQINIQAEPVGNDYRVKLSGVSFGAPTRDLSNLKPPKYPWLAQQAGIEALVVLVLRLDANGQVTDLYPERTSLSGTGPDKIVQQWRTMFENNAMAVARKWNFEIKEALEGKPAAVSAVRIPIEYRLTGLDKWQAMIPVGGPSRIPSWGRSWQPEPAQAVLRNGEAQSLTSNFKLKDALVGTYL